MSIGGGRCDRGSVVVIVVGAGQLLSEEKLPDKARNLRRDRPVLCVLTDGFFGSWMQRRNAGRIAAGAMDGLVD